MMLVEYLVFVQEFSFRINLLTLTLLKYSSGLRDLLEFLFRSILLELDHLVPEVLV